MKTRDVDCENDQELAPAKSVPTVSPWKNMRKINTASVKVKSGKTSKKSKVP